MKRKPELCESPRPLKKRDTRKGSSSPHSNVPASPLLSQPSRRLFTPTGTALTVSNCTLNDIPPAKKQVVLNLREAELCKEVFRQSHLLQVMFTFLETSDMFQLPLVSKRFQEVFYRPTSWNCQHIISFKLKSQEVTLFLQGKKKRKKKASRRLNLEVSKQKIVWSKLKEHQRNLFCRLAMCLRHFNSFDYPLFQYPLPRILWLHNCSNEFIWKYRGKITKLRIRDGCLRCVCPNLRKLTLQGTGDVPIHKIQPNLAVISFRFAEGRLNINPALVPRLRLLVELPQSLEVKYTYPQVQTLFLRHLHPFPRVQFPNIEYLIFFASFEKFLVRDLQKSFPKLKHILIVSDSPLRLTKECETVRYCTHKLFVTYLSRVYICQSWTKYVNIVPNLLKALGPLEEGNSEAESEETQP